MGSAIAPRVPGGPFFDPHTGSDNVGVQPGSADVTRVTSADLEPNYFILVRSFVSQKALQIRQCHTYDIGGFQNSFMSLSRILKSIDTIFVLEFVAVQFQICRCHTCDTGGFNIAYLNS